MSKRILAVSGCAAAVAAVYLGGVAATGYYINDALNNLNEKIYSGNNSFLTAENLNYKFVKKESGFFKDLGTLVVSDSSGALKSVDVLIEKGFLSAKASFDVEELKKEFVENISLPIDKSSAKASAYAQGSVFSRGVELNFNGSSSYLDKSLAPVSFEANAKITSDELLLSVQSDNFHSVANNIHFNSANVQTTLAHFENFNLFKIISFDVKGVKSDSAYLGDAHVDFVTQNVKDDGSFDLSVIANGDGNSESVRDYKADVTLGPLNVNMAEGLNRNNPLAFQQLLSKIKFVRINNFEGALGSDPATFIGVPKLENLMFKSSGSFDLRSLKGRFVIEALTKPQDEGRYFIQKDGKDICELEVNGFKVFINGNRFY